MSQPSAQRHVLRIVVVLYGTSPDQSLTLDTLQLANRSNENFVGEIVVWDNSPQSFGAASLNGLNFPGFSVKYMACPENLALSKVYNSVAEGIATGHFLILDQDSQLPADYFPVLRSQLEAHPAQDLFLPVVLSSGRCVSPGELWYFKGRHLTSPRQGQQRSRRMLAITSGMVIRSAYLQEPRFDERLSLYGIDTRFMLDYADSGRSVVVMPIVLGHDTALWSDISADRMLGRVQALVRSWPIVFERRPFARVLARCHARLMLLKLAIKYRDPRFLFA